MTTCPYTYLEDVMEITSRDIAKMIDHSLLRPELTLEDIKRECSIAKKYEVASVCCVPTDIKLAKELLAGSTVKVGVVVGFPHGYCTTKTKVFETEQAVRDGAVEVDMVIHIGKLLSKDFDYVKADIKAVVDAAHRGEAIVKVIFENYYLTDELKVVCCKLCEEAGADFVKTSTGFAKGGATIEDLVLMRKSVSPKIQVKAAGGVRDLDMALKVREAGCTRFGCTRTAEIVEASVEMFGK
jgi:deoxyribose-phosphate aldolase